MKQNARHFFRRAQYPLIGALTFFPMILLVQAFFAPELVDSAWQLPACYAAVAVLMLLLPRKLRLVASLPAGVGMVLLCGWGCTGALRWILLGEGIFYGALLLWSLPFGSWDESRELPVGFLAFGIGMYAFLLVLEKFFLSQENLLLEPIVPWLTYGLFAYLILTVLSMNRRGLIQATAGRQSAPKGLRRKNLLMTCLLIGGAAFLALLPQVAAWVTGAAKGLLALLLRLLISENPSDETLPPETTGEAPGMMAPGDDAVTPSAPVGVWFDYLRMALLVIAASALLFMLLRKLFRGLRKLMKAAGAHIRESGEDYEDEITDLRQESSMRRKARRENRDRWRLGDRGLSPAEKIRYRFRLLLRRHPEWNGSITAREKLPEELAGLYEQVRYGDGTATDEDAENFRRETKKR